MDRWSQFEETHHYPKHPEIKRRWAASDGDHPWLKDWNPWKLTVTNEESYQDTFNVQEGLKKCFREGTRLPQDDPDPDELHGLIIPEGDHMKDFKPPAENEPFKAAGNKPLDMKLWGRAIGKR